MSAAVFAVVLFAAALHATWNALIKGGPDKLLTTALVTGGAALLAAVVLPFLPPPDSRSWGYIAASAALQVVYYALVARTYRIADMSQAYPLLRGAVPLLVALASSAALGERLGPVAMIGVAAIGSGILALSFNGRDRERRAGAGLALLTALVVAAYTLVDGAGVRRSGAPASYTLWIFVLTGLTLVGGIAVTRGSSLVIYAATRWRLGLVGGACTAASYGLALWAMTLAPVAVVAALRETSILFAIVIARVFLGEQVGWRQALSCCAMIVGALMLRFS